MTGNPDDHRRGAPDAHNANPTDTAIPPLPAKRSDQWSNVDNIDAFRATNCDTMSVMDTDSPAL